MSKEKMYFRSFDDTTCKCLEWHFDDARDEYLETITLVEAIPDNINNDYIWCRKVEAVEEKEYCNKSFCKEYCSKSGRGVCKHRGKLYEHGNEVTFKVPA